MARGNIQEQEMVFNQEDTPSELNEDVQEQEKSSTQEETSERYVLPQRANRGVPPKRYSPEKVSRGSRYPIANIAKGNLSKEVKAFVASIYSDEIPANTEQALKSRKWKKAMEEEMEALTKNNTWKKCVLPHGKKTIGCHTKEGYFRLVGYPDWWTNGHKKGTKNSGPEKGKAPITVSTKENANTTDHKNLIGFGGMAMVSVYSEEDDGPFSMNTDESHLSTQPEDHVNVTQTAPNLIPEEQEMVFNQEDTPSELNKHVQEYKARLVAKGYTQTYGIDYYETFSLVAKINTIRVLCSVAANKGWPLHQFDVKNAFLHGELKEEVYMEAPRGFINNFGEREVCLLKKSLYGLKQSPRAWFGRFTLAMKNHWFKQSNSDHTLFLKQRGNLITCLIIYVDDMIVTGDDKEEITKLKKYLFTEFEMKDLGRLKYFLGIEVLRSKQGIFMCQKRYILDLLAETGIIDCKPANTPMIVNQKLYMEEKAELADKGRYQRMVGKLIYLSHTRPDIAYAMGVVSHFMHQPQKNHMKAVMRILRYLKGTTGHGVLFKPNGHLVTQLYTDADWAGDKGNQRSTSCYFTIVGGNLVTWRSKKQKVVSLSSAEAEF
ncbi:putative RNA-directed DNA polymerase [Tanacetum coccineum]